MKTSTKWIIAAAVVFFLAVGMLINSSEPAESEKIGSKIVYERIDSITNCKELQQEFNQAMDNAEARQPGDEFRKISIDYATYADNRMRIIGCY